MAGLSRAALMWDHAILAEANRRQSLLYAGSFLPGAKIFFLFVLGDVIYLLVGTYQGLVIAANQLRFPVSRTSRHSWS